jgi:chorismate mutase
VGGLFAGAIQLRLDDLNRASAHATPNCCRRRCTNEIDTDALISVMFTATPDITSEFPAFAAR